MKRLVVSFSGGRTSARMLWGIMQHPERWPGGIVVVFANTGQEHEQTLRFIGRVEEWLGIKIVGLEAVVDPRDGVGTTHAHVSFATASRAGQPFEAVVQKYGLPGPGNPHCTRELKARPIRSYVEKELGWARGTYAMAVGIRADEIDRISPSAEKDGIVYPLIDEGVTKEDVIAFWRQQPFDLYVPEHLGNCVWCWKKSQRKHLTLAAENPEVFDFPARLEAEYPFAGAGEGPRRLFRGKWTTLDIKARARLPFKPFVDGNEAFDPELDVQAACGDTCEPFADGVEEAA